MIIYTFLKMFANFSKKLKKLNRIRNFSRLNNCNICFNILQERGWKGIVMHSFNEEWMFEISFTVPLTCQLYEGYINIWMDCWEQLQTRYWTKVCYNTINIFRGLSKKKCV